MSIRELIDANHRYLISKNDILGALAHWAIIQSPYIVPDNLKIVLVKLNYLIEKDSYFKQFAEFRFGEFTFIELEEYLHLILENIPEYLNWNKRKNKSLFGFTSRYSHKINPDDDFIDLDALIKNTVGLVMMYAEEHRIFIEKFDKKNKKRRN